MNRPFRAVLLILVLSTPVWSYEEDAHFYLTYIAARMGGMNHHEARVVASADVGIDEAPATCPYNVRNAWRPVQELERINRALPKWHAMREAGGGDDAVRNRMAELYKKAKEGDGNLVEFGKFAHFMQDYYSHQKEGERFSAPFGHLFRGGTLDDVLGAHRLPRDVLGHSMDWLGTDPRKSEEMARAWLSWVRTYLKDTGRAPAAMKEEEAMKLLRLTLGKLIEAHQEGLSHEATEKLLNDVLKAQGVDFQVAPYGERIAYLFDEDGSIRKIDLAKDAPDVPLALDDASLRALHKTLEEAALSGRMPMPSPYGLYKSYRALEGVRLGDSLLAQVDAKLAQLRKRLIDLKSQSEGARKDLAAREKEVADAEAAFEKLKIGPCACGAATHKECKTKKQCDPVCEANLKAAYDKAQELKKSRDELAKAVAAADRAVTEVQEEIKAWEKRRAGLPAIDDGSWLPEDQRNRLERGASTTRTLRTAIKALLAYLPAEAVISSGYRSPEYQLNLIGQFAQKYGVPWREDATVDKPETWLETWRTLLEKKGVVINPPVRARRSDGQWVGPSPHSRGNSFDIKGAPLDAIVKSVQQAETDGMIHPAQIRVERENNCVHVQVRE